MMYLDQLRSKNAVFLVKIFLLSMICIKAMMFNQYIWIYIYITKQEIKAFWKQFELLHEQNSFDKMDTINIPSYKAPLILSLSSWKRVKTNWVLWWWERERESKIPSHFHCWSKICYSNRFCCYGFFANKRKNLYEQYMKFFQIRAESWNNHIEYTLINRMYKMLFLRV